MFGLILCKKLRTCKIKVHEDSILHLTTLKDFKNAILLWGVILNNGVCDVSAVVPVTIHVFVVTMSLDTDHSITLDWSVFRHWSHASSNYPWLIVCELLFHVNSFCIS